MPYKKGHKHSISTKIKIGIALKGKNKGKKLSPLTEEQKIKLRTLRLGQKHSEKTKLKMSKAHKGFKHSELSKQKISISHKGKKPYTMTMQIRQKMAQSRIGSRSHFWKGGVTLLNKIIRCSLEYRLWRESVFKRDNYTCIWCGEKRNLNADHIKPFSLFPELRFAIDNGRTLCRNCHQTTETWGHKLNKKNYGKL